MNTRTKSHGQRHMHCNEGRIQGGKEGTRSSGQDSPRIQVHGELGEGEDVFLNIYEMGSDDRGRERR